MQFAGQILCFLVFSLSFSSCLFLSLNIALMYCMASNLTNETIPVVSIVNNIVVNQTWLLMKPHVAHVGNFSIMDVTKSGFIYFFHGKVDICTELPIC